MEKSATNNHRLCLETYRTSYTLALSLCQTDTDTHAQTQTETFSLPYDSHIDLSVHLMEHAGAWLEVEWVMT